MKNNQPKAISEFYSKLGKKSAEARRKKIIENAKSSDESGKQTNKESANAVKRQT